MQNSSMSIPVVVFNYAIKETKLVLDNNSFQYFLIDSWDTQKQMLKTGDYVGICTEVEYEQHFQTRDKALIFINDKQPLCATEFYYIALYAERFQDEPLLVNFFVELEKYYR